MKTQLTLTTAAIALMLGASAPSFAESHTAPAENAEGAMENAGEAAQDAAEGAANTMENAAEGAAETMENAGEAAQDAAEGAADGMENAAENTGEAMNDAATAAVVFLTYDNTIQLTADEIVGMQVEGSTGERIGDVNQVVLSTDGEALGIVVGVGGFLGIGEKDVAVSFDRVDFAQDDGAAERKVVLSATKEELEAAPSYERSM